ncbi:hypothetical protein [Streptomyces sp. NPDC058304]|uniref:hypothetical protein n=1 Tax=Streptomyces sp. NPDC058304 TaxID=3346437 RepID=UPI0036E50180
MSRPGATGLRFGMFAVCVARDSDPGLNAGKAKPLYDLLVTFADVSSRNTGQGYPYRAALADCLDCSKQTVDRAAEYLEKEIGLVRVVRRKVEGKEDENDANLYLIFDAWLIHGVPPPTDTPPQLVARYGHTVPGLDINSWMTANAPDFDLACWQAAHSEKLRTQQAKREEQRRKERDRRKKSKKPGGGVTSDAAPERGKSEGGGVMSDATGGVTGDASRGVMGDALSRTSSPEPPSTTDSCADAVGNGAGGFAHAGASVGAADESGRTGSGSAASEPTLPPQRTSPRPATRKTRLRQTPPGFDTVRAAIPEAVARPGTSLYSGLHRAINDLLTGNERAGIPRRTATQLIARINRRWYGEGADVRAGADYRGCDRCTTSGCNAARRSPDNLEGCDRIINPNSWLTSALLMQDCLDPGCEDGQIIGGGDCRACRQRASERRDIALAALAAEERMRAETEVREAVRASATTWDDTAAAEEHRIRMILGRAGRHGALLEHEVEQHMTGWRERNPQPTGPTALHRAAPQDVTAAEDEPDYDEPAEDQAEEYGEWEQLATGPTAEYRAWREQQAQAKLAAIGR